MNLYYFIEARICKVRGIYYLPDTFGEKIWSRYLEVFDSISVVSRVEEWDKPKSGGLKPLNDQRIKIIDLPAYNGPFDYILKRGQINSILEDLIAPDNAYLLRVPGQIGSLAADILRRNNIPYGIEVVGDPWEAMAPQAFQHPFARILRVIAARNLKQVAQHSSTALYVTENILQQLYPPKKGITSSAVSDVDLNSEDSLATHHTIKRFSNITEFQIMSIGSLAQIYKSPDIVLKALAKYAEAGYKFKFTWFGDGKYREQMIQLADSLGIGNIVSFPGNVSHDEIFSQLKQCDIMIHASKTEGLPRAIIEAMAQGVPVIATNVGGIPELLLPEALVKVNDSDAVFEKLVMFSTNPQIMLDQSKHNLDKSRKFSNSILKEKRLQFFNILKQLYK